MASAFASLKALTSPQTKEFLSKGNDAMCQAVVFMIGKPQKVMQPLENVLENHVGDIIMSPVVEHNKVSVSRYVFNSKHYKRPNKTDCTTALLPSGACVIIAHILGFKDIFGRD